MRDEELTKDRGVRSQNSEVKISSSLRFQLHNLRSELQTLHVNISFVIPGLTRNPVFSPSS
jgi:hypothetical protein